MRFRKKPIEVEVMQFNLNFEEIFAWVGQWQPEDDGQGMWESDDKKALIIDTAEGEMRAEIGDWIIREPFPINDREFYPCKPDIFEQTYEKIEGN